MTDVTGGTSLGTGPIVEADTRIRTASVPLAELRAIPVADVEELSDRRRPAPVGDDDDAVIEGDDRHLDPDRYDEPEERDPLQAGLPVEAGRRGRVLIELLVVAGRPAYRLVDVSGSVPEAGAKRLTPQQAHDQNLALLGEVLVREQAAVVSAADATSGRAGLVRLSATELTELANGLLDERKRRGLDLALKFDRSFVSRVLTDRIRFPWGEVEVGEIARANRGDVTDDQLADGWDEVAPLIAAGATPGKVAAALGRRWRRPGDDNKKYARDFRVLVQRWATIDGLAFGASDGDELRAALDHRGIVLEKAWLYEALVVGLFADPTTGDDR